MRSEHAVDETPQATSAETSPQRTATAAPSPVARAIALQRAAGNRATTQVLARKFIMGAEDFHEGTRGFERDKTLKQLEERLKKWEKLDRNRHENERNDSDRVAVAEKIVADAQAWLAAHPDEHSSRANTVQKVADDARRDADRIKGKAVKRWGQDADKRMAAHLSAKDARSGFESLAGVLDAAVPTPGSKAEIEAEIEFALDPHMVGYVGCRLKLEADRPDASKIKARSELTFTAGAKFGTIGRVRLEIGGYLEAQGRTAKEVMQLISYAIYRTLRQDHTTPRWFVNKAWGGEFDSEPGYRNAEVWAAAVEKTVLGASEAYVEVGWLAGVMAEAGFKAGEVGAKTKLQFQLGGGSRWDKKGIVAISQEKSAWSDQKVGILTDTLVAHRKGTNVIDPKASYTFLAGLGAHVSIAKLESMIKKVEKLDPNDDDLDTKVEAIVREASPTKKRPGLGEVTSKPEALFGAQAGRAERTFWVKGSAEFDISIANMAVKYEANYQTRGRDKNLPTHMREAKVEGKFGVKLPVNKALGSGLMEALEVEKAVNALLGFCRTIQSVGRDDKLKKKDKAWRGTGEGLRAGGDLADGLSQLKSVGSESFKWGHGGKTPEALKAGTSGHVALMVIIDAKWKPGHSDGSKSSYEINFQVAEEKGFKFEAEGGAVAGRFSAKAQERWLRVQIKDGVRTIDFLGKTWEKKPQPKTTT